jgi:hypothetical protein
MSREKQVHQVGTRAADTFSYWANYLPLKVRTIRVTQGGGRVKDGLTPHSEHRSCTEVPPPPPKEHQGRKTLP